MRSLPLSQRDVFVDTGAYGALAIVRDVNHQRAMETARELADRGCRLYTTNFVVAETHALILARAGRDHAFAMLQRIDSSSETIIHVEVGDERRARAILGTYDDKDFTLVDALSFAVMERFGIDRAFTFDRHFVQYGFQIVDAP